jgi:ABC-type multidrug transport system fused ATPase/permease subunit
MSAETFAIVAAGLVFAGGAVGLILQRVLPEADTTGAARDMIGAVVGLLTLLSALVLGLLIWTAYGVYAGQNVAIQAFAANILQFDLALDDYGSEAVAGRAQLRQDVEKTVQQIWGRKETTTQFVADNLAEAIGNLRERETYLNSLDPSTDAQKRALAASQQTVNSIAQSRLQMSFALSSPVSYPLIYIVLAWAVMLFCGFGLMSRANAMSVVMLAFGALAVASCAYLILSLSSPYSGLFRASPAPLEQVLAHMRERQVVVGGQR